MELNLSPQEGRTSMRSVLRFLAVFIIALVIGGIFIPGCELDDGNSSSGSSNSHATNNTTVVTNNNTSCANYGESCNPTQPGGRQCCAGRYCEYNPPFGDGTKTNGKCL